MSGCHGNRACWEKNKVEYFDNVTTLTCSESFMKICDHECPAPFKIFWFLSGIALNISMKNKLSSSNGSCIRNFRYFFFPIYPIHSRSVYDPTRMILAILYSKLPHMLHAKYQPNWHSGSGEEVV